MKVLIVSDEACDFTALLDCCGVQTKRVSFDEAVYTELSVYDRFCILPKACGIYLEPRFRVKLETECAKGKRIFLQGIRSFLDHLCKEPENTVRSRLIYLEPENGQGAPGLCTGDLLDEESNQRSVPELHPEELTPLLMYQEHIIAHAHTNMDRSEILKNGQMGLWQCGDNVLWSAFILRNFNKARFAPRQGWRSFLVFLAEWITGNAPVCFPEPVVTYGIGEDLGDPNIFENSRRSAIERGVSWLSRFLVDEGKGGIREGLHHNVDPDGNQEMLPYVRTDCTGECAGVYKMYAYLTGKDHYRQIGRDMDQIVYDTMLIRGGICDGMVRWCMNSWSVCYQDDVARAILPGLYDAFFLDDESHMDDICLALDFLVKTTAKDGLRIFRTDKHELNPQSIAELADAEHGVASAHYNAYYHAALLLAGLRRNRQQFIDTAVRGLETLMGLYPDTAREQSETEEMCRLILPLSVLYKVTRKTEHREMLYRVVNDLQRVRHPFGGYQEWDSGYQAAFSRESTGECSVLTENGDPVADLLYSMNWLPLGFAFAYDATGDPWFLELWRESVAFCLRTQMFSENPLLDGGWCRAFDMDRREAYAAPHDAGWAAYACETGWTTAEILMGMMMPEIMAKKKN